MPGICNGTSTQKLKSKPQFNDEGYQLFVMFTQGYFSYAGWIITLVELLTSSSVRIQKD